MRSVYTVGFRLTLVALMFFVVTLTKARSAFHFMQIEQIIGGVNGDTSAQAIQLRMRSNGQNILASAAVRVVDAAGANSVLLENMTTNVTNSSLGSRVLLMTPSFASYMSTPVTPDYIMDPIPVSYLAAGQVRFMDNASTIYWSVSWGGSSFTGATTGSTTNDSNGNFGPPVDIALPSTSLQALRFTGAANALSTSNNLQYALTEGASTWINNAGQSSILVAPSIPETGDFDEDGDVDGYDFLKWQRGESPNGGNAEDLELWQDDYGTPPGLAEIESVPEPGVALGMALAAGIAILTRRRQVISS